MHPMSFKEFLIANHINLPQIDYLYNCFKEKKAVISGIHDTLNDLFKKYVVLGGMPEVVRTFYGRKRYFKSFIYPKTNTR